MGRKLMTVALATLVLAGCAKEELASPNEGKEKNLITFNSPVTGKNVNTKVNVYGEIGTYTYTGIEEAFTYPREENFRIFAVQHTGNLTGWDNATPTEFNNSVLAYDISVDSWAPKKTDGGYYYWPDNTRMSFAALSPADLVVDGANASVNPSYSSSGFTIENFTTPDDPAKHFDLMFSKRTANQTAGNMNHSAGTYSGIQLEFQHALSSIHFSVAKDNTVTEDVKLISIIVKNVKNKGTFKENITEGNDGALYNVGDNGNVKPAWTIVADSKVNYTSFNGEIDFTIEPQYVSALADTDDTSYPLLVLPQGLDNDMTLEIKYQVGSEDKTKEIILNGYPQGAPLSKWEIGYKYIYRLYYSKSSEKKDIISFGPSTDKWADGGKVIINL